MRIYFCVSPFQVRVGYKSRSAVTWTGNIKHIQVVSFDNAVKVRVDKVLTGGSAPVAQKHGLDMFRCKRCMEQGIVMKVDLSNRKVIGSPPVCVDAFELRGGQDLGSVDQVAG